MDYNEVTSGDYEEPVEVGNVSDERVSLDFDEYCANRLSPQERQQFETSGFCLVQNALPDADRAELQQAVAEMRAQKIAEGRHPEEETWQALYSPANGLQSCGAVRRLLTQPAVFPKVVDLLGANIFSYHAYTVVTPAAPEMEGRDVPASFDDVPTFPFHQCVHHPSHDTPCTHDPARAPLPHRSRLSSTHAGTPACRRTSASPATTPTPSRRACRSRPASTSATAPIPATQTPVHLPLPTLQHLLVSI